MSPGNGDGLNGAVGTTKAGEIVEFGKDQRPANSRKTCPTTRADCRTRQSVPGDIQCPRYGLDGEPAGEVTADQMAAGKSLVATIEAKRARRAKVIAAARKAAKEAPREVQPATSVPYAKPARLGLAELKAAARARREAAT